MTYFILFLFVVSTQTGAVSVTTTEFSSLQACYDTLNWAQQVAPNVGGVRIYGSCRLGSQAYSLKQGLGE